MVYTKCDVHFSSFTPFFGKLASTAVPQSDYLVWTKNFPFSNHFKFEDDSYLKTIFWFFAVSRFYETL